jgi:hypothetical protein
MESQQAGIEIVSPAGASDPEADRIRIADFTEHENGMVESLPKSQKCWCKNVTKNGIIICGFDKKVYAVCSEASRCPGAISGGRVELRYTPKNMRLSNRCAYEQTEEFKKRYAMRAGIEGTNTRLARETGPMRSKYRGISKIRLSSTFKVIG